MSQILSRTVAAFRDLGTPRSSDGRTADSEYQLIAQVGAGVDGVRYRAIAESTGRPVDFVALAEVEASRQEARCKRLRCAVLLRHPSARRIDALPLDEPPTYLVLEPIEPYSGPADRDGAVAAAWHLAAGLAEAHRLGLTHGRLCPAALASGRGGPCLDWTALELDDGPKAVDTAFVAPERGVGAAPSPEGDVYALGAIVAHWAARWGDPGDALHALARDLCAADPTARPTAAQVAQRLGGLGSAQTLGDATAITAASVAVTLPDVASSDDVPADTGPGTCLGRYRLCERLGEGGMGTVFRAEDLADGTVVALKIIRPSWARRPEALARLFKEARLLTEANNPFVANLVEINQDGGTHFLAIEFVAGPSLAEWLAARETVPQSTALAIVADVARGLAVAHERGIIHRDIKPGNVLLADGGAGHDAPPRVKLADFGLARHVAETESLHLTATGAVLGTPLYMAPEQSAGVDELGPPADVYALGALLFRMLAGRPPFEASSVLGVIAKHRSEPPPNLKAINPAVSDGVAQLVAKALAKRPGERYADAGAFLQDIERLRRGEPTAIAVHPRLPACDPRDVLRFDFRWELESSPAQLWPHVSNTERLNRALGLQAVAFTSEYDPVEGVRRFGQFRTSGIPIAWREYPFEWVEGRRMGVLREFRQGPFAWFVSEVELAPGPHGGTVLTHGIRVAVRGLLGRTLAHVKLGKQARRSMDRVYRRIDAALTGKLGDAALADPFEPPPDLSGRRRERIERWVEALDRHGIDPSSAERLGDYLALAPAQEVARIRPLALARRLGLGVEDVTAACLLGAKDGVLLMLWDLLCPVCRIPSQIVDTLKALRDHGRCEACHSDYPLDFAQSVELIFRAHPDVRETELGTYCIGGPAHSPHVAAQVRVGAGERMVLDLELGEGAYRLRGPQLAFAWDFRAEPGATLKQWEVSLAHGTGVEAPRALRAGEQHLGLTNETEHELLVRIERTAARDDAFTAARASALALFRELFPGEVLAPGQVVSLATITLLVTEPARSGNLYEELGDAQAFALVHEHFRALANCVKRHGGTLVKTINEGSVSAFDDPAAAIRAALELTRSPESAGRLPLRVGVHRGAAMAATLNDRLDYFGAVVSTTLRLAALAPEGGVVVTRSVAADAAVAAMLRDLGMVPTVVPAAVAGLTDEFVHRLDSPAGAVLA